MSTDISDGLIASAFTAFNRGEYEEAYQLFFQAGRMLGQDTVAFNLYACQKQLALRRGSVTCPPDVGFLTTSRSLSNVRKRGRKFVASLATMPSRLHNLERVIQDVSGHVDEIHVFLNNYAEVPDFLKVRNIVVYRSQDHGDQRDNGKFFALDRIASPAYFFTLDDDLSYPPGYFTVLADKIDHYQRKAAVGVHGVIYPKNACSFFKRITFNFERELCEDVPVSVLGTGTLGFHTSVIKPSFQFFSTTGMADLVFAKYLKERNHVAVTIARPARWLSEQSRDDHTDTIYAETRSAPVRHDQFLRQNGPWGIGTIKERMSAHGIALGAHSHAFKLLRELHIWENSDKPQSIPALSSLSGPLCGTMGIYAFSDHFYMLLAGSAARASLARISGGACATEVSRLIDWALSSAEVSTEAISSTDDQRWHLQPDREWWLHYLTLQFNKSKNYDGLVLIRIAELLTADSPDNILKDPQLGKLLVEARGVDILFTLIDPEDWSQAISDSILATVLRCCIEDNLTARHAIFSTYSSRASESVEKSFVTAIYEISVASPSTEESITRLLGLPYKERNKLKHLQTIRMVADTYSMKCRPSHFFEMLAADSGHSELLKLSLAAFLISQCTAEDKQDLNWPPLRFSDDFDATEIALWHAELGRRSNKSIAPILEALNEHFFSAGLKTIESRPNSENVLAGLTASSSDAPRIYEDHGKCVVVIAAFNAERTLQYAYDSLCSQSYRNIEIVIVDDQSSVPVSDFLKLSDSVQTTILRNQENSGPYACRNVAARQFSGDFFAIHDADDWAHPDRIGHQIQLLVANPHAVCCYARHLRIMADGQLRLENHGRFIGHGPVTSLFRFKVFSEMGHFDNVRTRGDTEFKSRLRAFYGNTGVIEDSAILVLALDWDSNSKQHTATMSKKKQLARYKAHYSAWHQLLPFTSSTT